MAYFADRDFYVINQPVVGNPFDQLNNKWTVGLFSCCDDISRCCFAYWCWCCFLYKLTGKINEPTISCCCVPNALGFYRTKVRSVLKIEGDSCNDYCVTSCCPLCAALQMDEELNNRGITYIRPDYDVNSYIY